MLAVCIDHGEIEPAGRTCPALYRGTVAHPVGVAYPATVETLADAAGVVLRTVIHDNDLRLGELPLEIRQQGLEAAGLVECGQDDAKFDWRFVQVHVILAG